MTDYHTFTTKDMPMKARRRLNVGDIWLNSAKCLKCGDIITSNNRHDFKWCTCRNIAVDGGSFYSKRIGKGTNYLDLTEMYDDADSVMLCQDCGEPFIPVLDAREEWDGHTYKGNCTHFQDNLMFSSG